MFNVWALYTPWSCIPKTKYIWVFSICFYCETLTTTKHKLRVRSESLQKGKFCLKVTWTCWGFSSCCFAREFVKECRCWRRSSWKPSWHRRPSRWSKFDFVVTIYTLGPTFIFVSRWVRNNGNIQRLQLENMGQMQGISATTCKVLCPKRVSVKKSRIEVKADLIARCNRPT